MSLSKPKRVCLRSDTQKRQSFGDRICDDLSEDILQYLPLKHKFRLESVSKQFQRTIFTKQKSIHINGCNTCDKYLFPKNEFNNMKNTLNAIKLLNIFYLFSSFLSYSI